MIDDTGSLIETAHPAEILAIGPWRVGEFAVAWEWIASTGKTIIAPNGETATEKLAGEEILPEFILLAQPLPGTYEPQLIDKLRRLAPLAQIVIVAGTWCEGELRTGKPLAGVLRLYWYEVQTWWQTLECRSDGSLGLDGPLWPRQAVVPHGIGLAAPVAVYTAALASFEAISASLGSFGIECFWYRLAGGLPAHMSAGVWDGGQLDDDESARLQSFAATIHKCNGPLVVLLDFPRKEHYWQLQELGCSAILGKPYLVEELVAAIHRRLPCQK